MRLELAAGTILAAGTDTEARHIRGLAVPYDTPGATSAGMLTVNAGALTLPTDVRRIKLLYGHDRDRPAGAAIDVDDTPTGLGLTFAVTRNTDGDRLLAELDPDAPARDGLSVELDDVTLDGDRVTAARLVAVAAVPLPAYTEARAALAAGDTPEGDTMPDNPDTVAAPADVEAATPIPTPTTPATTQPRDAVEVLASSVRAGLRPAQLEAALSDFTSTVGVAPQWIGELWRAEDDRRPFIDAVSRGALNSSTVLGFRYTAGMPVDSWSGGKTAIPSTAPTIEAVTVNANYLAGGVDVAREVVDLGSSDVLRTIIATAMADYRRKTELAAISAAVAGATALTANADAIGRVSDAVVGVLAAGASPDYVFVGKTVAVALMKSAASFDFLGGTMRLSQDGNVGGFSIAPLASLADDMVLAGDRRAFTFYEKNPPVVVDAVDIARGGLDEAVHGYYATLVNDGNALVKISAA